MIHKTPSVSLIACSVMALLLVASDSLAFKLDGRAERVRQSPEPERRAVEVVSEVFFLFEMMDSQATRLRLQEIMRVWVQLGKPEEAAQAALQIAENYKRYRKYEEALYCYKQALDVKSLPGSLRLNILTTIALLYARLYNNDLALHYFTDAFDEAQAIKDISGQVFALTRLAELYLQQGDKVQALASIKKAERLNEQRNGGIDPTLLYLSGQIQWEEGLIEAAKSVFEEALVIYTRQGSIEGQVETLCSLSAISLRSSQNQQALEQAVQAAELADHQYKHVASGDDKTSARQLIWRAILSCARAERALGQIDKATQTYERGLTHFEAVWWARYIATETGALASREEAQMAYRELVDLLMEQGLVEKAYEYAEQAKARAILNLTAGKQARSASQSRKQTEPLRGQAQLIAYKRNELLSSDLSPERRAQLQKEISDAESKLQEERLLTETITSRDSFIWANRIPVKELKKQMAQDQAALVEFFLDENRSFAWMFVNGELFVETLPARSEIEKSVKSYLSAFAAPPKRLRIEKDLPKLREQAKALFSNLFGGLADNIKPGQQLIVVPDGLLYYLPFETLIHNDCYLIEDHEISYDSSSSMLGLLQNAKSRIDSKDRMEILAVGDPVFDPLSKTADSKKAKIDSINVTRQMQARGFSLPSLPRTLDEVQFIANLFPADRRKLLTGMASTEEAIKHEQLSRYRRLHFATHSLIDEKSPLRSAVVLTPDNSAAEDGLLEVGEISKLNLDCDLVVVSACQTGRGQLLTGEGILGLSWAFFRAGARSVVVSLWNVTDISTSQLMKNFYQGMTGGLSNAAALRKAKLQMLNSNSVTRHPYYWSAFIIIGKP